jgi:hypothetical protein
MRSPSGATGQSAPSLRLGQTSTKSTVPAISSPSSVSIGKSLLRKKETKTKLDDPDSGYYPRHLRVRAREEIKDE